MGVWEGFRWSLGWSRVVKRGSAWPPQSNFCPSGCLVWHQTGFQTPHNGPIGQCFQVRHHWPIYGPLGPPWWLPKGPFWANQAILRSRTVPNWAFWPMKSLSFCPKWPDLVQNAPSGWSPQERYSLDPIHEFLVSKRALLAHVMAFWELLGGVPTVPKWASDA